MSADSEDPGSSVPLVGHEDVVGAFDRVNGVPAFVIADVADDDAWLAVREGDARPLPAWR